MRGEGIYLQGGPIVDQSYEGRGYIPSRWRAPAWSAWRAARPMWPCAQCGPRLAAPPPPPPAAASAPE
eukprot:6257815-Pyramimonas_sp.AAC.1